jgi:hypothetical protein
VHRFRYSDAGAGLARRSAPAPRWGRPTRELNLTQKEWGGGHALSDLTFHLALVANWLLAPKWIYVPRYKALADLARPRRFERPTFAFGGQRIVLSSSGLMMRMLLVDFTAYGTRLLSRSEFADKSARFRTHRNGPKRERPN